MPGEVNTDIPPQDSPRFESLDEVLEVHLSTVNDFIHHLDRSVMLRVLNIPQPSYVALYHLYTTADLSKRATMNARVAVLFSGGIDSTVVAFFAHKYACTISANENMKSHSSGTFLLTNLLISSTLHSKILESS